MTKQGKKPPRIAERLLSFLVDRRANPAILGDLEEEFSATAESRGEAAALIGYWKLILISLPSFVQNRVYWSVTMFRNYFKIAFRNILRSKLFAAINLLGLAVGMACFILISLWVQDELSFDGFHVNKDHLFLLTIEHANNVLDPNVPYALPPLLAAAYPEIRDYTRIYELGQTTCSFSYQPEDGPRVIFYEDFVGLVDRPFFSMFSFPFVHGDPASALENPNSLVIREEIAAKYFGDENPLGKKLTFNGRQDLIVTGVVRIPPNSQIQLDFISPLQNDLADDWNWRDPSYILLDPQTSLEDFREKIVSSLNENAPYALTDTLKVDILPMEKVHLGFGRMTYVYIFSVIAVFILLIACINYMNLITAGSGKRAREVGLRKVVGAGRGQLIHQFLGESVLMSALAFALSLILVKLSLPVLNSLTAKDLALSSGANSYLYVYLLGLVLIVGILAGSYPALFLTASKPVDTLRAALHFSSRRSVFRVVTVVGQFTISVLLIASTLVVFKQMHFVQSRPLGLNTDQVLKIRSNPTLLQRFSSFKKELLANPLVSSVTRGQAVPYDEDYKTGGLEWAGKDPELNSNVRYSITDFDFIETFGIEVVEGRSFAQEYPGDRDNFIINQKAAEYMGMDAPVGQRLSFWGTEGQIIGVVKDFHHVSLHREIMPHVFCINPRYYSNWIKYVFVKIASENIPQTIRHMEAVSLKLAPDYPFEYTFLDQGVAALYDAEQRLGKIFTYFAFLAIFISCLGILGLSAFIAEQRTKEIGIRKVLGSTASGIVVLLSRQFAHWVLLANIIAWPLAYYAMHTWLQGFAYRTGLSFDLFILAGVLSLLTAALPTVILSLKAANSDPVDSLRYE
jgi:ABC-type antimicrobial peptide transport system permease subunit